MKRAISLIITLSLVVTALTGCGAKKDIKTSEILNQDNKQVAADIQKKVKDAKQDIKNVAHQTTNETAKTVTDTAKEETKEVTTAAKETVSNVSKPSSSTTTPAPTPKTSTPTPTQTTTPKSTVQAGYDSSLSAKLTDFYGLNDYNITSKSAYFNSLAKMVAEGTLSTSLAITEIKNLQSFDDTCNISETSGKSTYWIDNPMVYIFKSDSGDLVKIAQKAGGLGYTYSGNYLSWGAYKNSDGTYTISRVSTFLLYSVPVN